MRSSTQLYCPKCVGVTFHASQGRYDHMGHLTGVTDTCLRCGNEAPTGDGHEAPAADPPPVTLALTDMEISRARFQRWRIEQGHVTEWPGYRRGDSPGVWG